MPLKDCTLFLGFNLERRMKLKFRSSLSLNKFNPFDSQSEMKPIDLSLKSRIKNFMKKTTNNHEFKASSNSLNSINSSISSNSISPTNSLNHQYDQQQCATSISMLASNLHNIPPSPPNSIEEDEEEYIQQIYYNQLRQKQYENQQLTDLLNSSHLNQAKEFINQFSIQKAEIHNNQLANEQLNRIQPASLNQTSSNRIQQHMHYQKQMVIKHASQMNNKRLQNYYNPYSQTLKRKYAKQNSDEELDEDYYDSTKLISKLRMKYCSTNKKQQIITPSSNNNQANSNQISYNAQQNNHLKESLLNNENLIQNTNSSTNSLIADQLNNNNQYDFNLNFLQTFYEEFHNYLLSQPDANAKLSALEIMKSILGQKNNSKNEAQSLNNQHLKVSNTSIETQSLLSSPSPNSQHQINFSSLNNNNAIYLSDTSPYQYLLKDSKKNEKNSTLPINNQQEERKRSTRPLTGRHVRQGMGASATTLANLKLAIKERQKFSSFKPIKRKGK